MECFLCLYASIYFHVHLHNKIYQLSHLSNHQTFSLKKNVFHNHNVASKQNWILAGVTSRSRSSLAQIIIIIFITYCTVHGSIIKLHIFTSAQHLKGSN